MGPFMYGPDARLGIRAIGEGRRPGCKGAGTAPLGREKLLMVAQSSLTRGVARRVVVA